MEPLSANDPATIGEFTLRARLGSGGMGRVYLASSPAGRAVAIKVVHPELARDPEFRERFSREVAAARAVSGMYTAPVVAAGLDDDPPWLATAFVPGPSLAAVVNEHGPMPEQAVWRLAAGLAEALSAVHACGLVHRDLKPANVLLAADGPHVIDFGISRAFEGTALTSVGTVVGTPGYMSPEQAEGKKAGPESDVFSLGCMLAYAATGRAPFGAGHAASVLFRVVNAEPDLAGIGGQLRQVIESCLTKNPAERTGLPKLSAAISARGPAVPAAPGSFWPDPVASIIAADQARPAGARPGPAHSGPAPVPASPAPAPPSPAPAFPGSAYPSPAPLSAAAGGYQPTATALGGPRAPGPGAAGHAEMVPDGYLSAATSGMGAAGQAAIGYPRTPPSHAPQPAPQQLAARRPGETPGTAWPRAAAQTQRPQPWPPGAQHPGTPASWPPAGQPTPLGQYSPGRRRPARADVPAAVIAAIRLMYAGAAASLLGVILGAYADFRYNRLITRYPHAYVATVAQKELTEIRLTMVLGGCIAILCWILIAAACRHGRQWARPVATTLFGLHMVGLLVDFSTHGNAGVKTVSLLIWIIGLTTVILLWSRSGGQFFRTPRDLALPRSYASQIRQPAWVVIVKTPPGAAGNLAVTAATSRSGSASC